MRKILFFVVVFATSFLSASYYSVEVTTTLENRSSQTIDMFSQVTNEGYPVKCYRGEGCLWNSWPVVKLAPGESANMVLFVPKDIDSRLSLAVLSTVESDLTNSDDYILEHMMNGGSLFGTITMSLDSNKKKLLTNQTGNLIYSIDGSSVNNPLHISVYD